jgi:hypothetical protein
MNDLARLIVPALVPASTGAAGAQARTTIPTRFEVGFRFSFSAGKLSLSTNLRPGRCLGHRGHPRRTQDRCGARHLPILRLAQFERQQVRSAESQELRGARDPGRLRRCSSLFELIGETNVLLHTSNNHKRSNRASAGGLESVQGQYLDAHRFHLMTLTVICPGSSPQTHVSRSAKANLSMSDWEK